MKVNAIEKAPPVRTVGNRIKRKYNPQFGEADLPLKAKLYGKKGREAVAILGKGIVKSWSTPAKGRNIPVKEFVAYSGYTFGVSSLYTWVAGLATAVSIPYYYGLKNVHGYIIGLLSILINFLVQPLIARLFENTNTKYGKYKPFVLLSMPLLSLFAVLISAVPMGDKNTIGNVIYVYFTFIPASLLSGIAFFMWQTFPSIITSHQQERVDIVSPAQLVFGAAPSVLQVIRGPLRVVCAERLGSEIWEIRIVGAIMAVLGFLFVLSILRVKERVYIINIEKQSSMDTKTVLKELFSNKPLIVLSLALIIGSLRLFPKEFMQLIFQINLSPDIKSSLNFIGVPLTIIGFATTVATILLPILTREFSKRAILVSFTLLIGIVYGALAAIGLSNIPQKIIEVASKGGFFKLDIVATIVLTAVFFLACVTPELLLIPIMLGDVCDYQQSISGRRYEGHIQNFLLVIPLVSMAIGRLIANPIQNKIGFEPTDYVVKDGVLQYTAKQVQIANNWFRVVFAIGAIAALGMGIVLIFYPLSKKKHEEAMKKIKENSVDATLTEKRRVVVEKSKVFLASEYKQLRNIVKLRKAVKNNKYINNIVSIERRLEKESQYMNGLYNVSNANRTMLKLNKSLISLNISNGIKHSDIKRMQNMLLY